MSLISSIFLDRREAAPSLCNMSSTASSVLSDDDSAEEEVAVSPSGTGEGEGSESSSICDVARVIRRRIDGEEGPAVDDWLREVGMWLIER
jgi:hypothetical protein